MRDQRTPEFGRGTLDMAGSRRDATGPNSVAGVQRCAMPPSSVRLAGFWRAGWLALACAGHAPHRIGELKGPYPHEPLATACRASGVTSAGLSAALS